MRNGIAIDVMQDGQGRYSAVLPRIRTNATDPFGVADTRPAVTQAPYPEDLRQGFRWARWGLNDNLPTEIRQKLELVPMAGQAVYKLVAMMYGNGLVYVRNRDIQEGELRPARIPAVEQFLRRNRIRNKWLLPQFADYRYYQNSFSELIFSRDRRQITGLFHKTAEHCRVSIQNPETLLVDYLYYSPEFGRVWPRDNQAKRIPFYQWQDEEAFFRRLRGFKMAWHSRFETPGSIYYARPFWLGLFRKNGWLDVSAAVPEIVNSMMKNQIVLKYQILIPETYFELRFPDWNTLSAADREARYDKLVDEIDDTLRGTDNAYRSITMVFAQDPVTGNPLGKVEIVAIDDKTKKDSWVPSSEKSDAQIVQGLGLHPSQVGLATEGGKMGAGSGSDQRESFNTSISLNTMDQEIVLEPLNYLAQYNARTNPDWDVTFYIAHTHHTTINNKEDGLLPDSLTQQPTAL